MSTQTGQFTVGSIGLFIHIQVADAGDDTFDFSAVSAITLKIIKPTGVELNRLLASPDGVINPAERLIQYTVQAGDLSAAGSYAFRLTITFGTGQILVETGSFTVADDVEGGPVVEDGTGMASANSYASVAEAETYHAGNLYADEWNAATYGRKTAALKMATRVIDTDCLFRGFRKSTNQALDWPRIRAVNDDFYGQMPGQISAMFLNYYDESSVPEILKKATAQVALDLLRKDRTLDSESKGLKSVGIGQGAVSLSFDNSASGTAKPLSDEAKRLLSKIASFRYGKGSVRLRRVS